jgi:hypothetical protein
MHYLELNIERVKMKNGFVKRWVVVGVCKTCFRALLR